MVRSLYSGISGLRNHQVSMDVTGNNIANVNTVGFKTSRVTFEESMSQLLQGATRPAGNAGGTNPLQVGLGMSIGSIDQILTQGNLQTTGQITDLALEGQAYFAYSNGLGTYYSRNGGLQFDSTGRLVSPTNGFALQGIMAASDGTYPVGSSMGDIRVPYGQKAPAQATTEMRFACNLDSDSSGLGTVTHTNRYITQAQGDSTLTELFDRDGNDLGIEIGDEMSISIAGSDPEVVRVTEGMTLNDFAAAMQTYLTNITGNPVTVSVEAGTGSLQLGTTAPINGLQVSTSRPGSNSYVSNAFSFPATVSNGYNITDLRKPANESDLLANVFDASGNPLGLEDGDVISVNGAVGGKTITTESATYTSTPVADPDYVSSLGDLLNLIQNAFSLPETDGTIYDNPSVSLNQSNTNDDRLPDGSIVIRGQAEEAFAITNLSITATNANNSTPSPIRFNTANSFTEIQTARDTAVHSTSIMVYDESGDAHTVTTTFTHTGHPNEWLWEISTENGEEVLGGNRGRITFGEDGSPSSFSFDDNSTQFKFDPMNGSNVVMINLNTGSPGSFDGITQFRSESTTAIRDQNGYPMGKLQEVSIDEKGEITGVYSNGVTNSIARIYVAEFNNPAGLMSVSDSMYTVSNNSGGAVMLRPGVGSTTQIKPGALEMSNVDLASEFTNMITTQRGYQANARVITTSDSLLQELVQLVR